MTDWEWSEWITPGLVAAKANIGNGDAGASASIGGSADPHEAVDAVRVDGTADGGSSLAPPGTPPYTYHSSGEVNGDLASGAVVAVGYDRAGAVLSDPPVSFAMFNVGYSFGYWRERPELRRLPPEFVTMIEADPDSYVRIKPGFDWDSFVEFEDGDTVAVEWADVHLEASAPGAVGNGIGGSAGFAATILLPASTGWASFGAWPPPLGSEVAHWGPTPPTGPLPTVKPPAGSDFTVTAYTDMAVAAYPPDDRWQRWVVRPHGGPLGDMIYIWHQMPRYRYRRPVTAKPRFFVKDLDGVMRPVGFGKPATETAVFRVPTAVGMYRDLTTTEYATYGPDSRPPGGYPLKVKRRDTDGADWWDHVGWMVPQTE